ncbi:unnamed protein product [Clonostachys rosea]|uniref:Uncharacterized protein n=1 Tax=Bionectria ochroleuca TaxID=29856 RepID=A0ABY6UPM9_BIOOC|nr:unnamed protein product [Clonostachys rosea]
MAGYWDYLTLPFTVDLNRLNGKIGTIKLRPKSGLYCTGNGDLVNFKYRIQGTTVVNGESQYVDATGFITVSSSDWKGFARPDISNVSYNWPDNPQVVAALTVPSTIAGMPDDLLILCGANKDQGKVGMNSTTHSDILSTVTNYLTQGIFWVNEKLIGWAFGNFLPF